MNKGWPYTTPGIPDEAFVRDKVPMTKEEVRVLTLAKARLAPKQIVWDIGSGTGSISIEAACMTPGGTVYAVEKNSLGIELARSNANKFGVSNISFIQGEAPSVLKQLPDPDRIIIGGSGGQLKDLLELCLKRLKQGGRMVINAVTIDTIAICTDFMKKFNYELIQVSISRAEPVGKHRMWRALNPVFIISCEKE